MVVAGDMMFQDQKFDMNHVAKYFESKRNEGGDLAIYYHMDESEPMSSRGILEICPFTNRVTKFLEKPRQKDQTRSRNASVVFYFLRHETCDFIKK